jgi:hypothetical protein
MEEQGFLESQIGDWLREDSFSRAPLNGMNGVGNPLARPNGDNNRVVDLVADQREHLVTC